MRYRVSAKAPKATTLKDGSCEAGRQRFNIEARDKTNESLQDFQYDLFKLIIFIVLYKKSLFVNNIVILLLVLDVPVSQWK